MSLVIANQQTKNKNTSAGFGQFTSVRNRGQVFTAAQTRIDAILFYCQYDGGANHIGIKVTFANVDQTTNLPTTDIYSFTIPYSAYVQNKFNRFTLPAAVTGLTAGQKYCVYFSPWDTVNNQYQDYYRDLKFSNNDADFAGKAIKNTNGTWSIEANLQLYFQLFYDWTIPIYTPNYAQPALPNPSAGWNYNGVDAQITSKYWNQDATKIQNEVAAIVNETHANIIAAASPLDNLDYLILWLQKIHAAGKLASIRAHYNGWEGDNDFTVHVTAGEYQARFYKDIQTLAPYLVAGDSIAMCCEANRAHNAGNPVFTTSGSFDYTKYNDFQKAQVHVANKALADAGVTGVHTWAISHSLSNLDLAGQTLDSGDTGDSSGLDAADIAAYFQNRLSFDHYLSDTYRQTNSNYAVRFVRDLEKIHDAFPNAILKIDELGYHVITNVSDEEQRAWYDSVLRGVGKLPFIAGLSCWNHMGQSQSSLWTDTSGSINTPGRPAVAAIKRAFDDTSMSRGW